MTKTYTVSEVLELQNRRKQLDERLAVHKSRAQAKEQELQEIFKKYNVKNIEELSMLCAQTNAKMQEYANKEKETIDTMESYCAELDAML